MIWMVLVIHAAATWFLVGLIWTVQRVHYPLMDHADSQRFPEFEAAHQNRIIWLVGPAMGIEALTAAMLVMLCEGISLWLAWLGLILLAINALSTAFLQMPLHGKLVNGFDLVAHQRLVRTNWIRTVAWSARGIIALLLLLL